MANKKLSKKEQAHHLKDAIEIARHHARYAKSLVNRQYWLDMAKRLEMLS